MGSSVISGDNILNKILKTHVSDGCGDADLNPLLRLVEDILNPANASDAASQSQSDGNAILLAQLSSVIHRISYEISYKAVSKADPESTAMTIFEMVGEYSWEVKLVMSMAAFALHYGNFLLLNQTHSSIRIAKSIALIRNLPAGIEQSINPLKELIDAMMNVARCVVEFKTLPAAYVSWEAPEFRTVLDHFRVAAYFTVRSVVACSTHITSLTNTTINTSSQTSSNVSGSLTTQIISMTADSKSQFASFELAGWTQQLVKLYEILTEQLKACRVLIEEKRSEDFYQMLVKLFEASQPDKLKILEALFCTDGSDRRQPTVINCSAGTRVGIDMLVEKSVLLFISGPQISQVELVNIKAVYEKHATTHEVVWIPIVDEWAESIKPQFEERKGWMPWYTICQPESINKMVIRFVKEKWQFQNKPMILVLGPDGKVVCRDAFQMVQIWGCQAFPFNSATLDGLWGKVNWNLDFLIRTIEPADSTVWRWIKEEKNLILLCGGDSFDKVKTLKDLVSEASGKADVPSIEMVYAGKSSKWEQVKNIAEQISNQKIGYCLGKDVNERELFWKRLESILVSKIEQNKVEESDKLLYELQKLLNYDKDKEWTMLCRGTKIIACGPGSSIADAFKNYDTWCPKVASDGFDKAFKDYLDGLAGQHPPDCRIELPVTISGSGPANFPMKCPDCGRPMRKCITFTCSHEGPTTIAVSTTTTTTTSTSTTATATLAN